MQANTLIFGATPAATAPGATTTILVGVNNTDNPPSILYLDGVPPSTSPGLATEPQHRRFFSLSRCAQGDHCAVFHMHWSQCSMRISKMCMNG